MPQSTALVFVFLIVSTHASPLLNNLLGNVIVPVNGVVGNLKPIVGEVTGIVGGCKRPDTLTKLDQVFDLPETVDPTQFVQLLSILTQLDSVLTRIICAVDSLAPLESGSRLNGDPLNELRSILNIPTNVKLETFLQRLVVAVEKLLDDLLNNLSGLLIRLLTDVDGGLSDVLDLVNGVLGELSGLLGIPPDVLPLDFVQQLIPQLQKVLDSLGGQVGSGSPVEL